MPCPREKREAAEALFIGPHGLLSTQSTGRLAPEPPCEMRTCFQRDVDRITHSKSFRRLKHKTQVFLRPEGDHYRTRLTHTLEVARLARTIARALELNEDLTEAISLGTTSATRRSATRESARSTRSTPASASGTMSRACASSTASSATAAA